MRTVLGFLIATITVCGQIPAPSPQSGSGAGSLTSITPGCSLASTQSPLTTSGTLSVSTPTVAHNGAYAILAADCGKILTTNVAAADTIAQAGTTGFEAGKSFTRANNGTGVVTITAATSTFVGAGLSGSVLTVAPGTSATVVSDAGGNWQVNTPFLATRNITQFGVDLTGSVAANTSILAAIASFGTNAGLLDFPCGKYLVTDPTSALTELFKIEHPISIRGCSGAGGNGATEFLIDTNVSASTDLFRYSPAGPSQNNIAFTDFWVVPVSGTHGRYAVNLDASTNSIFHPRVSGVKTTNIAGYSLAMLGSATPTGVGSARITGNSFYTGIYVTHLGESNEIDNNTLGAGQAGAGHILYGDITNSSSTVTSIHNNFGQGGSILLTGGSKVLIRDNDLELKDSMESENNLIHLTGAGAGASANILSEITGNTISPSANGGTANGIMVDAYMNDAYVANNVVHYTGTGTGPAYGLVINAATAYRTIVDFSNVFIVTSGGGTTYDFLDNGSFTLISIKNQTLSQVIDYFSHTTQALAADTASTPSQGFKNTSGTLEAYINSVSGNIHTQGSSFVAGNMYLGYGGGAYIHSASGEVGLNASGTNQNINLIPTGSGIISASGSVAAKGPLNFVAVGSPSALTAGAPTAGGSCTAGTHSYKATFVNQFGETLPSATSNIITCVTTSGQTVPLSGIPVGPTGTTGRNVYRTVTGNTGNYLLDCALSPCIADNSTTTYGDTIVDGSLGAAAPASDTSAGEVLQVGGATVTTATSTVVTDAINHSAPAYLTNANCANAASPAVCGSAAAGAVAIPTGVTSIALTVNTTAITANSRITLTPDDSLTIAATTCNSTLATLVGGLAVTARSAGVSFTVTYNGTIATNPLCVSYTIEN